MGTVQESGNRELVTIVAFRDAHESVSDGFTIGHNTLPIGSHYWRFNCGPLLESLATARMVGNVALEAASEDPAFRGIKYDLSAGWSVGMVEVAFLALVREFDTVIQDEERTAARLVIATNERLGDESPYLLPPVPIDV